MGRKLDWSVRATAYEGLLAGRAVEEIATELGVARRTVDQWARLAGMTFHGPRVGGLVLQPVEDPAPSPDRAYRRLTLSDRVFIEQAMAEPMCWSRRQIARHLGVSASTISREISKHQIEHGRGRHVTGKEQHYHAQTAHHQAMSARHQDDPRKLDHPALRAVVVAWLNEGWSPRSIAGRLSIEFPDDPEMHVSHETIYQALYVQGKGTLRHELTVEKALRSGRKTRKPQSKLPPRKGRPWVDGARLTDRPDEADDRKVAGHWEGDLVVGQNNSGLVTLVERCSRFALIGRLPGCRDSRTVIDVMQQMIATLPEALFATITWDQGSEMAQHAEFTVATDCKIYFCDPHSPWQRPSNEHLNGLIRQFYPKGTDFNTVSDADLAEMQRKLNTRPRESLEFWTPCEKLRGEISVALAA